jgi:hypothetical protein
MRKWMVGLGVVLAVCWAADTEKVDLGVLHRIRTEAFGANSRVMDTLFYLTDVYGPRLTGSPNIRDAADWSVKKMKEWGLSNVKLEAWGPFGRGWAATRFSAMMKEPEFQPIIGFQQPWSPGTNGPVVGQAVMAVITGPEDLEKWKGKLKGKIVLSAAMHASPLSESALSRRLTDQELENAAMAPDPSSGNPAMLPLGFARPTAAGAQAQGGPGAGGRGAAGGPGGGPGGGRGAQGFRAQLNRFLREEGVLVVLTPGNGPDGGTIMGQAAGSATTKDEDLPPPSVVLTNEHYNRIARLLAKELPVTLEFDLGAKFTDAGDSFNLTAEIPGTDPNAGFVMLGGHFDSWTGGTGATDNGAGSAVAMEAMRILKAMDVKMTRTVRLGLWTAEEQGLLGSRAYVKEHFADPTDMKPKPEHPKLSAYYNVDNGSGKVRGIYMQDNDQVRPIFESWIAPLKDMGVTTLTIRNTGSTDHMSFDGVGLPAFQFIQDPLEYGTRTHHSNMDVYDHLSANDLEQASAVMAWFVYNTASRPEMMPRKPMPKPGAGRGGRGGRGE